MYTLIFPIYLCNYANAYLTIVSLIQFRPQSYLSVLKHTLNTPLNIWRVLYRTPVVKSYNIIKYKRKCYYIIEIFFQVITYICIRLVIVKMIREDPLLVMFLRCTQAIFFTIPTDCSKRDDSWLARNEQQVTVTWETSWREDVCVPSW